MFVVLVSLVNLYLGFSTMAYLRCGCQAGTWREYAGFLVHREAFAALARVRPRPPRVQPRVPPAESAVSPPTCDPPSSALSSFDPPVEVNESDYEFYRHPVAEPNLDVAEGHPVAIVFQRTTAELREMLGELSQLDRRLREAVDAPHGEALQACAVSLNETVHRRLELLQRSLSLLHDQTALSPELMAQRAALDALVGGLTGESNATLADLVGLSFGGAQPQESARSLLLAQERVCSACHVYRDLLLDGLLAVVRAEIGCDSLDLHLRNDEQTGLAARPGLETAVLDLQGKESLAQSAAVLVDVDQLGKVNKEFGVLTGDLVIGALAEFLASARRPNWLAARVAGQQFILLCGGARPHEAAEAAERVRQSIEKTTFRHGGKTIRVTVSAAAVTLRDGDSTEDLLERAATVVREAKSYGRNRTFLFDKECPTPVVPPDLSIPVQELNL
jgi:diguanylate cyclase (GGDEF)-like protein